MYSTHFDSVCCEGSVSLVLCTVTVKLSLYMPRGHMGEVEAELYSFLISIVDGGQWSALPRKEHPLLIGEVATWASIDTQTLWTKEKPLATAGNQSMIPWSSSTYCSHHTVNCATLAPTDTAFCWPKISVINYLDTQYLQNLYKVYGEETMCITRVCASSIISRHKGMIQTVEHKAGTHLPAYIMPQTAV